MLGKSGGEPGTDCLEQCQLPAEVGQVPLSLAFGLEDGQEGAAAASPGAQVL